MLPYYTLYPRPRSILILNNASIYKLARLHNLYKEHGILLIFLPLYLLDFNPIKATCKDLKAWIKRNYQLAETFKSCKAFLHFTVSQSIGAHAEAHYRNAGYIV